MYSFSHVLMYTLLHVLLYSFYCSLLFRGGTNVFLSVKYCIRCRVHCIRCRVHCIRCRVHCIRCRVHCIRCWVHCIRCRVHCIRCRVHCIRCRAPCLCRDAKSSPTAEAWVRTHPTGRQIIITIHIQQEANNNNYTHPTGGK